MSLFPAFRQLIALTCLALAFAPAARAENASRKIESGNAELPISGLAIELPFNVNARYQIVSSFSLDPTASVYDGRDVIDEFDRVSGRVINGNWVLTGFFNAGECDAVVAGVELEQAWTADANFWGHAWKVRGGIFKLDDQLGKRHTITMCRKDTQGRQLLLYRILADQSPLSNKELGLKAVAEAQVLQAASRAYDARRFKASARMDMTYVKNRGDSPPSYRMKLPLSGIEFQTPDDGTIWLASKSEQSDFITRMIPSLPGTEMELMKIEGLPCTRLFEMVKDQPQDVNEARTPSRNIPTGWVAGPVFDVEGEPERVLCRDYSKGAILAGLFLPRGNSDVAPYKALLDAITAAVP